MELRDLKYLSAYIIPLLVLWGVLAGGLASYAALIFAFGFVPLAEPFFKSSEENLDTGKSESKGASLFFEAILLLNVPIVYLLIYLFADRLSSGALSTFEITGLVLSYGTLLSSSGINVAHELGHKNSFLMKASSILLLIPSLYTHFHIEHNLGHHKNVGTPADPATARKNESLYSFWLRSTTGSYLNAWRIEISRLHKQSIFPFGISNRMVIYSLLQLGYLGALWFYFGPLTTALLVVIGIISFLFLETINYVEHYGLFRKKLESGRYERVQPWHSWNSNHHLGRIILYELTRHSDHHYLAHKKYQLLDHHESSPQLPFGYPTSMLMSMVPPIWFKVMNKRIESFEFPR